MGSIQTENPIGTGTLPKGFFHNVELKVGAVLVGAGKEVDQVTTSRLDGNDPRERSGESRLFFSMKSRSVVTLK